MEPGGGPRRGGPRPGGPPARPGPWRADLRAYALSQRRSLLRHRRITDYAGGRPALGPNTIRAAERSMALLDKLDLDAATTMNIVQSVNTYVLGGVLREFQELQVEHEQAQGQLAGGDPARLRAAAAEWGPAPGHVVRQVGRTPLKDHSQRTLVHTRYRRAVRPRR